MGRPLLPNSPLIEVVCELRFSGDLSLFQAWGSIQRDLRSFYANLLVPAASDGSAPLLQPIQLATSDGKHKVLLAINSFAVSTHAYQGYDEYVKAFESAFEVFARHVPITSLTRLGLRYINALPRVFLPEGDEQKAATLHPCLRLELQGWNGIPSVGSQPSQLVYSGRKDSLELRLALAQQPEKGNAVHLDLDCFQMGPVSTTRVGAFLQEAHALIEETFFAVITDDYHEYLKGTQ